MGDASRRKKQGTYPAKTTRPIKPVPESVESLQWKLLGDIANHPKGDALVAELLSLRDELDSGIHGNTMTALLETSDRKPLLAVRTVGMTAWIELISVFQSLELDDRLAEQNEPMDGYDAIFS